MAKKTHVKVRLVPESKPDSPFYYYVKKPAGGEKAKVKLSAKKYNPATPYIKAVKPLIVSSSMPGIRIEASIAIFNTKNVLACNSIMSTACST